MVAIWRRFGARMVLHLAMGGLVYTIGAGIELLEPRDLIPGVIRAHELFHVACLGGLAFHWRLVWVVTGHETGKARGERLAREGRQAEARAEPGVAGAAVTVCKVQGSLVGRAEEAPIGSGQGWQG